MKSLKQILYFMWICFLLSGLGEGWAPAVLNSRAELNFLKQAQKGFSDDRSYWLGGCTSTQPWSIINLSKYRPGDSCNKYFIRGIFNMQEELCMLE